MKRRRLWLAIGLAVAAAFPGIASAYRLGSRAERSAMLYHAGNRTGYRGPVDMPRRFPARCALADIATVVAGGRWGAYTFDSKARGCVRFGFNGITYEHKIGKRWYVLWEGSSGNPPNVPRRIENDLYKGLRRAF